MDSRAAERLIRSLSFDVEAIPQQDNALKAPTNQAPMNLKIRVRKKEGMVLQKNTVLTIPNMSHPERAPERVRLASSDTTIMSFDVLMETDSEKRPAKKHRRLFGGCFGTKSDDEETPYEPGSTKKDSKSDTNVTLLRGHGNEIEKPILTENKNTAFFGNCKPGGCLDPPFGEDRYKYQPKRTTNAKVSSKDLKIISSKDKITNKSLIIDRPSLDMVITTAERGRIRNKSASIENDSRLQSRQTSKSSFIGAKIIETVVGSRTIIIKDQRKSNNDLDTTHGSGRSSRDDSPDMYSQSKRGSRYQDVEPITKRSRNRSNSVETELKQQIGISEHTMNRKSRENSPEINKVMHDKSQHPLQIPGSRIHTYVQQEVLENDDSATTETRKVLKTDSKDHSLEPRGLTQSHSRELHYQKSSKDHISKMEKEIQIPMSSKEGSPEPKTISQTCRPKTDKNYEMGSRDRIPEVVKQSSTEHSPESNVLTQMQADKYQRHSRDSIHEIDRRVKIVRRGQSLELKGPTQVITPEPDKHYQRDSRDVLSEMDRQVKQSSRERSPESDTSMKKIKMDHIPVKIVEKERPEDTKVELTKRNSTITAQKMSSNALAKGVDDVDNTTSYANKERNSYTIKQKKPKKTCSNEISGDISKVVVVDDTDSIITYPPAMTSSELQFEEKKIEKRNNSKRNSISNSISSSRARSSVNEFTNKYFSPPKKDKVKDSYASILNTPQDNVFVDPSDKETTHKTGTVSEILPKDSSSLESTHVRTVEKSQLDETSEMSKKSPYAISKDFDIRNEMNIPVRQGRKSIDTLDRKQEININSNYKPIQIMSDLNDDIQNYPFHSMSEMYEVDVVDDTQQNATVAESPDEIDRIRADDQLSENGTVYPYSQNLARISKSNVQTNNVTADYEKICTEIGGSALEDKNNPILNRISEKQLNTYISLTTGMTRTSNFSQDQLHYEQSNIQNTIPQENTESTLYRTLNDAENISLNKYHDNYSTENTFQDTKSYFNEISERYSSIGGNNAVIANYDKLVTKVHDNSTDYYAEDKPRNYVLSNENLNGDRISDSYEQIEAKQDNNYSRLQDEMHGKEPDNQRYRPTYFKEDNYYAPTTDVEKQTSYYSKADYYELDTDEENKSPYFREDGDIESSKNPENKSPSNFQNSVEINSFRTLDEDARADSNDIRSKRYHSGDSRLPVKEDFTQLHAKKIRESTDEGIKSQDWQDFINKEGISITRAATPPRSYMIDSKKIGSNEFYAENLQQRVKETKRETPPVEYYDDNNQSRNGKQVDSVFLELAIQTQLKNEDAILKSSDVSSGSNRVIKTVLNAQNDKLRIPIDDQNELSIQYKKLRPGSTASSQRIQFLLPRPQSQSQQESEVMGSMHATNTSMKDDRKGDVKGTPLYPLLSLERFGSDLRETLSYVYENQLVPLQNTIKSLKEDIDFLATQQLVLRDRIHVTSSSRRIRPVRIIHSSKKCVCIGNPRY